jgi:hypothetical protein
MHTNSYTRVITCYEGRTPDTGEITDDIKEECGDLEIRYIEASECPKGSLLSYVKMLLVKRCGQTSAMPALRYYRINSVIRKNAIS